MRFLWKNVYGSVTRVVEKADMVRYSDVVGARLWSRLVIGYSPEVVAALMMLK